MITRAQRRISSDAHKTPQFWLIWAVLCLNVSAGIGVIGMASPMLQEIFGGTLIGIRNSASPRSTPSRRPRSRRSPPASPACSRCSISAAASSGRRCRTISAARHLLHVLPARHRLLRCWRRVRGACGSKALFVARLLRHPVDVWRRLRHRAGLSRRYFRHAVRRRHPWPPADRVVDRRHHRPGGRQLHPRSADRRRRAARPGL